MKQYLSFAKKMIRISLVVCLLGMTCLFVMAMKTKRMAEDVWAQLGVGLPQAQQNINNSFIHGYIQYYGAKNAKNILAGNRVAVVNDLVAYAKKYYSSGELKAAWAKYRAFSKPKTPERFPETAESIKAEEKFRLETGLKQAEAALNSPNPKIKNSAPAQVDRIKKELAALDDPNNATIQKRLDLNERSHQQALKMHAVEMEKFNAKFPEDPNVLLKKRLEEILAITADVDYDAELKEAWGKKVFVNPVYEKKHSGWKLAYRAGKQATDAVRAAAEKWLNELK